MLKLFGAFLIMGASAGLLWEWRTCYRKRICQMERICAFYRMAIQEMEVNRTHMPVFFLRYARMHEKKGDVLVEMVKQMATFLKERTFPTGEKAWEEAFHLTEGKWCLSGEEKEWFLESASAFFGNHLSENVEKLECYEKRLQNHCRNIREEYLQKNKVWTPVGMLLGVMVIVILL